MGHLRKILFFIFLITLSTIAGSTVFNENSSKAYVVNQGDDTVSVIDLKPDVPVVEAIIYLQDVIPDKDLAIKPIEATLSGKDLLIGTKALKSVIAAPIAMAVPLKDKVDEKEGEGVKIPGDSLEVKAGDLYKSEPLPGSSLPSKTSPSTEK